MALKLLQELRTEIKYHNKRCFCCSYCSGHVKGLGDRSRELWMKTKYILVINHSITGIEKGENGVSKEECLRAGWTGASKSLGVGGGAMGSQEYVSVCSGNTVNVKQSQWGRVGARLAQTQQGLEDQSRTLTQRFVNFSGTQFPHQMSKW